MIIFVIPKLFKLYEEFNANFNKNGIYIFALVIVLISFIEIIVGFIFKREIKKAGFLKNIYILVCLCFYIFQYLPFGLLMRSLVIGTVTPLYNLTSSIQNNPTPYSWSTYENEDLTFKFPSQWTDKPILIRGGGYTQEFDDPQKKYILTFLSSGNYNQITGKPYTNIDEYVRMPYKTKIVTVDGQEGRQPLPRAGSENANSVVFFSIDSTVIFTLELQTGGSPLDVSESDVKEGQELFDQILSSFRFKNEYSNLGELLTANVLVQDASYYGPPYDPNLYQLEITKSNHLFAKSNKVDLKQYLGKSINVSYREVMGVIMGEQQLVIIDSVK